MTDKSNDLWGAIALNHRYAAALDGKDWELLGSCYTADGRMIDGATAGMDDGALRDEPQGVTGPDAIVEYVRPWILPYPVTQHVFAVPDMTFDGDRAEGFVYAIATHVLPGTPGGDACQVGIKYEDVLRRADDEWRYEKRLVGALWMLGNPDVMKVAA